MSIRPLSSYNVCYQLQQEICDVMNQSQVLLSAGIEFIAEDSLSIEYQIKESLQKQGIACVVMTPTLDYLGHTGEREAFQLDDLTILFVEYVPINRAKNRKVFCSGIDLANYTSELLAGPNAVIGFGKLCTSRIEQGEDNGLLVTKLVMKTWLENGVLPIIYVPFATKEDLSAAIQDLSSTVDSKLSEVAQLSDIGDGAVTLLQNGEEVGSFSMNLSSDISVTLASSKWGSITGNIDDQSDLSAKFNDAKDYVDDNFVNLNKSGLVIYGDLTLTDNLQITNPTTGNDIVVSDSSIICNTQSGGYVVNGVNGTLRLNDSNNSISMSPSRMTLADSVSLTYPQRDGRLATTTDIDDVVGDINEVLDNINGEVI